MVDAALEKLNNLLNKRALYENEMGESKDAANTKNETYKRNKRITYIWVLGTIRKMQ